MDARVVFSNQNTSEKLSKFERGRLHYEALERSAKEGQLQFAKNKVDVAKLAGYTYEKARNGGWQWVNRLVKHGFIEELPIGYNDMGTPEYQYTLTTKPYTRAKRKTYKKKMSEVARPSNTMYGLSNRGKRAQRLAKIKELDAQGFLDNPMRKIDFGRAVVPNATKSTTNNMLRRLVEDGIVKLTEAGFDGGFQLYKFELLQKEPKPLEEKPKTTVDKNDTDVEPFDRRAIIKTATVEVELDGYGAEDIITIIKEL